MLGQCLMLCGSSAVRTFRTVYQVDVFRIHRRRFTVVRRRQGLGVTSVVLTLRGQRWLCFNDETKIVCATTQRCFFLLDGDLSKLAAIKAYATTVVVCSTTVVVLIVPRHKIWRGVAPGYARHDRTVPS